MKQLNQVLTVCIWTVAVLYVIFTRTLSAFLIWWSDNGDKTLTAIVRFVFHFVDAIGEFYYAGRDLRRWTSAKSTQVADYFYFQLTAV